MSDVMIESADRLDLARRRRLASARAERETQRNDLLATLIETDRRATALRAWIDRTDPGVVDLQDARLARMLDWARRELAALEAATDLAQLSDTLRTRNLFPQSDPLADPFGDPPPAHPWGW